MLMSMCVATYGTGTAHQRDLTAKIVVINKYMQYDEYHMNK